MALPPPNRQGHRLCDPPGRCIYCDATDGLTDEHVIPQGLGGREFIPDASCEACRKITGEFNGFEGVVQRQMFRPLRVSMGLRSRKRKLAKEIDVVVSHKDSDAEQTVSLRPDQIPVRGVLPEFARAGLFRTGPVEDQAKILDTQLHIIGNFNSIREMEERGFTGNRITYPVGAFSRMLAKIGHCQTVAHFGLGNFTPYLRGVISGHEIEVWPKYIGSVPCTRVAEPQWTHWINLFAVERLDVGGFYIQALIRLFANVAGAPLYEVITGHAPEVPEYVHTPAPPP